MGWTGLQYSVLRAGTAAAVAATCHARLDLVDGRAWPLLALGVVGALGLVVGWRDRALTLGLLAAVAGVAAFVDGAPLVLPGRDVVVTSVLLLLHAATPVAPYGSIDARDRVDPRGDWKMPVAVRRAAWIAVALLHAVRAFQGHLALDAVGPPGPSFAIVVGLVRIADAFFVVATFVPRWRANAWLTVFLLELALATATPHAAGTGALLLLHLFVADPSWWPGRPLARHGIAEAERRGPARLYYDGSCGFCHRAVRLVLAEDANTPEAHRLRFAPLGGPTFAQQLAGGTREPIDPEDLPDSIVLVLEDGRLLTRSAAALEIASRLGGFWRGLALLGDALPAAPLDGLYDFVARIRKRLFAEPDEACPILPPAMRARFDP